MAGRKKVQASFSVEYAVEDATLTEKMKSKVVARIGKLANGYSDISGVAVALTNVKGTKRNADYRCRLVVYSKPDNIAAVRMASTETVALKDALDAVERQMRGRRERMRERSRARRA